MTLTTRLFRLFSLVPGGSRRVRVPRLESLRLSNHDLADLNLPHHYRARMDLERPYYTPDQRR